MPQIIKDSDGNDIEVFSAEELDAQKQEAIEAFKAENPDKTAELAELQEKLRIADEELAKKDDGDRNFANLRKGKEDAEKKLSEFTKSIDDKINTVKREVLEGVNKDHYNEKLKAFAGGDDEVEKRVKFEYENTLKGVVPSTKEEITAKLQKAYVLATTKESDGVNMNVYGSGGVGRVNINSQSPKFSAEEKELGAKFGLEAKDFGK